MIRRLTRLRCRPSSADSGARIEKGSATPGFRSDQRLPTNDLVGLTKACDCPLWAVLEKGGQARAQPPKVPAPTAKKTRVAYDLVKSVMDDG